MGSIGRQATWSQGTFACGRFLGIRFFPVCVYCTIICESLQETFGCSGFVGIWCFFMCAYSTGICESLQQTLACNLEEFGVFFVCVDCTVICESFQVMTFVTDVLI